MYKIMIYQCSRIIQYAKISKVYFQYNSEQKTSYLLSVPCQSQQVKLARLSTREVEDCLRCCSTITLVHGFEPQFTLVSGNLKHLKPCLNLKYKYYKYPWSLKIHFILVPQKSLNNLVSRQEHEKVKEAKVNSDYLNYEMLHLV